MQDAQFVKFLQLLARKQFFSGVTSLEELRERMIRAHHRWELRRYRPSSSAPHVWVAPHAPPTESEWMVLLGVGKRSSGHCRRHREAP